MDNTMKTLKAFATITLIIITLSFASIIETTYTRDAVVDKTEGLSVHFVDTTGRGWWYDGCYAEVGEEVKLIMHTNNTDNYVEDDIIKDIKFVDNK
jgi:hypothetical protein